MQLNPFHDDFYQNPAESAQPYLEQIPETIKPYYEPYINAGKQSLSTLSDQYQMLLNNPQAIMSMAGQGFQQSPGYQYQMNQGMNAANNAAAAGGMLGTPSHQQYATEMASNIANQDYYNYLDRSLGLYGAGLSGEQGNLPLGYGASNELANSLGSNLMNQGNLAYLDTANQNQTNADMFNSILGGASTAAGAILGGPAGAALGSSVGKSLRQ